MDIDSILESSSKEELTAFLSCYVPIAFSDTKLNSISKLNYKKINNLITAGPKDYIEPVCINACQNLWDKNIYALGSIEINNDMYLILDKLSAENIKIFKEKYKKNSESYCLNLGTEKFRAIKVANYKNIKNADKQFVKLVKDFKLQDIQRGYLTEKTFLMNVCDCEKVEGLKEYKKQDLQVVFDVKKMNKSFKAYLQDTEYKDFYVPKEHRIYLNEFFYNAHKNYLDSLSSNY